MNADPGPKTPTQITEGLTDEDISRALDRLAKARVRLRDVTARVPAPSRARVEAIERAHRAVGEAAAARERRPDDPAADKTHALAEIAEIMAVRREGLANWNEYEALVSPPVTDPRTQEALRQAKYELAAAQAHWNEVKVLLTEGTGEADDATIIDLTGDTPTIDKIT